MAQTSAEWFLVLGSSLRDTTPKKEQQSDHIEMAHFDIPMLVSEESNVGIVGTLHRWDGSNPRTRKVYVISIDKGIPSITESKR
jgi:hypothetical protein